LIVSFCHLGRFVRTWTPRATAMALAVVCAESTAAAATGSRFRPVTRKESAPFKVLDRFVMKDGRDVSIIGGSLALIENPTRHTRMIRHLPQLGMLTHNLVRATRDQELAAIAASPVPAHPYVDGEVVVVLRSGTRLPDRLSLTTAHVRSTSRRVRNVRRRPNRTPTPRIPRSITRSTSRA
jgi:hypothetical protein